MAYSSQKNSLSRNIAVIILFVSIALTAGCGGNKEQDDQYAMAHIDYTPPIHVYVLYATSMADIKALNEAANVAKRTCSASHERAEILDTRTQYQGYTDQQKNLIEQASTALDKSHGTFSELDYKITIRFRCLPSDYEKSLVRIANQQSGDQLTKKIK